MLKVKCSMVVVLIKYLFAMQVHAMMLTGFGVVNESKKSIVILDFQGYPIYHFHLLHQPERLVVDVSHIVSRISFKKFPICFSNSKLIQSIYFHIDELLNEQNVSFMFHLSDISCVDDIVLEKINGFYRMLFIITKHLSISLKDSMNVQKENKWILNSRVRSSALKENRNPLIRYMGEKSFKKIANGKIKVFSFPIVVAIDAGHGGNDPGAKGYGGLYEKDVTLSIAKKLKKLLDRDSMFFPIMTRDGDYYISVFERSELARNKGAQILLSIHADAISRGSKKNIRGASVWVLSHRRAHVEMTHWLENSNRWSRLYGGISNILMSSIDSDEYFYRTILDLQFSHFQKIGYEIAVHMLRELKNISVLHKYMPEYSNFGILRSLDIPSVLIETGFMSHEKEEKLLSSDYYQEKIAYALYNGLRSYLLGCLSFCIESDIDNKLSFDFRNYNCMSIDF